MIQIRVDELLAERGRTFYWLAQGDGHQPLDAVAAEERQIGGHQFATLERICRLLSCQPGDVLRLADEKRQGKSRSR